MQTSPLFNSIAKISPRKARKGTSYQVAVALVNQFLSEEDELSTTGIALKRYIIGCAKRLTG